MKTIKLLLSTLLFGLFLASCSSSYSTYAYDDLYYSPNNDPVKQVQANPRKEFNKTDDIKYDGNHQNPYANEEKPADYPQSIYKNRYTEAEANENNQQGNQEYAADDYSDDTEYYDEDYAENIQQLNSPVTSYNTYNSNERHRI